MRRTRPGSLRGALGVLVLLALRATAAHAAAASDAGAPAAGTFALGLPERSWRLLVDLPGFQMDPVQQVAGGARARGTADAAGLSVSLTLATSAADPSARSCRDHDWAGRQKSAAEREDTRLSEQGAQARVEFIIPRIDGEGVRTKHVLLYLQREGVCAVVHLSKLAYQPADAASLERLLGSVRLSN